ncbi:MAG: hypothetical protein ABIP20_09455 [Chthoniobacteraceae bacterium]
MNIRPVCSAVLGIALLLCVPACATTKNPHFFPRLHPLFAGLDESKMRPAAKAALAEAKVDFLRVRHGQKPQYAHYAGSVPYTGSKIYEGRGYRLTMVHEETINAHSDGPSIVVDRSITGGESYSYDEIDTITD